MEAILVRTHPSIEPGEPRWLSSLNTSTAVTSFLIDTTFQVYPSAQNHRKLMHTLKIGRTPVFSSPVMSEYFGIENLAIKDESANLFGTHKDRKSLHVVIETIQVASHLRHDALCILTAGNAGLSLAKIGALYGVPTIAFVGADSISSTMHEQLKISCETTIPLDIEGRFWSSDELCRLAGAEQGQRVRDVTNGIIEPFEYIVDELCELDAEQLPDTIVLPIGSGELFLGVAKALERCGLRTRLIGVKVGRNSAADKLYTKWRPCSNQIDAITNLGSHHRLYHLEDEALLSDTFDWLRSFGLQCEPSSAASFAALRDLTGQLRRNEKVLVINTGTFKLQNPAQMSLFLNQKAVLHHSEFNP